MNISDMVDDMISQKPEASPQAETLIAQAEKATAETSSEPVTESSGQTVLFGGVEVSPPDDTVFNPEIHATDTLGNPKKNKDGTFAKKRGRKKGVAYAPNSPTIQTGDVTPDAVQCYQAAVITVHCITLLGRSLGGDEWEAKTEETKAMIDAWNAYYLASGVREIPPWLGVAIATGGYAVPRFTMPKTRSKLALLWNKLSGVKKWFGLSA